MVYKERITVDRDESNQKERLNHLKLKKKKTFMPFKFSLDLAQNGLVYRLHFLDSFRVVENLKYYFATEKY